MSRSFFLLALAALLGLVSGQTTKCGGAGYDYTSIANIDYSYFAVGGTNYTYVISPCGTVTRSECDNSMFCQIPQGSTSSYSLATYNSSTPQEWLEIPGQGVQQIIQDGAYCSAIHAMRETTLFFICDAAATTPYISSVKEVETCHYQATFRTAAACTHQSLTGPHQVGESFISSTCGAGVYDLSSLQGLDLVFDSNTSSTTGWSYHLRVCGDVTKEQCMAVGPSMLCQASKSSTSAYLLSTYNSSVQTVWTVNRNGVSMQIQDGSYCGAIGAAREMTLNFECDPTATTPRFTKLIEPETCWYTATVQTAAVCTRIDIASSSGTSPSIISSTAEQPVTPTTNSAPITSASSLTVLVAMATLVALLG